MLQYIKKHDFEVVSNGVTFITNYVKIQPVINLKFADQLTYNVKPRLAALSLRRNLWPYVEGGAISKVTVNRNTLF
jgi:hypothetical protein